MSSFEEGCERDTSVVLLCSESDCGFFYCRDLDLEPGGVQLTRGGAVSLHHRPRRVGGLTAGGAVPGCAAMRNPSSPSASTLHGTPSRRSRSSLLAAMSATTSFREHPIWPHGSESEGWTFTASPW